MNGEIQTLGTIVQSGAVGISIYLIYLIGKKDKQSEEKDKRFDATLERFNTTLSNHFTEIDRTMSKVSREMDKANEKDERFVNVLDNNTKVLRDTIGVIKKKKRKLIDIKKRR